MLKFSSLISGLIGLLMVGEQVTTTKFQQLPPTLGPNGGLLVEPAAAGGIGSDVNVTNVNANTGAVAVRCVNTLGTAFESCGGSGGGTSSIVAIDQTTPGTTNGVSVTNFPATQAVSGTVGVNNFPATQPVTGPLTDVELRASAVPVSGPLTDVQLRASAVSTSVSNFPAGFNVNNIPAVSQSGPPWSFRFRNPLDTLYLGDATNPIRVDVTGTTTQPVSGTFWQATQPVSGTFWQTTQPVSGTFWQATQPVSIAATIAADITDRAARLLGVIYGSQGQQLKQTATNFNLQSELFTGATAYDARQTRALTSTDVVTANQGTPTNWAINQNQINGVAVSVNPGISDTGTQRVVLAQEATYAAGTTVKTATTAGTGPFFSICGSGTKTIRVQRVAITATVATTAVWGDVVLKKTSTATSAGTATALTKAPYDSNSAAATATVNFYTALATAGTSVGNILSVMGLVPVTALAAPPSTIPAFQLIYVWRDQDAEAPTLRGTTQCIEANFGTTTTNAPTLMVSTAWTEK
jgi:hypothetical protein